MNKQNSLKSQLREVLELDELVEILKAYLEQNQNFLLWINSKAENIRASRSLYQASFINIEVTQGFIQLKVSPISGAGEFIRPNREVFIKGKLNNLLFKTECVFHDIKNQTILLKLPKKITVDEKRRNARKTLRNGEYKLVEIVNPSFQMHKIFSRKAQLLDWSEFGMGIGLHPQDSMDWEVDETVELASLNGHILSNPIRAHIENISSYEVYDTKRIRVGLSFYEPVDMTNLIEGTVN